jgi:transcriptional regulator with XRE-family HTH domain
MNDIAVGRVVRAIRRRKHLRQIDVAIAAGVSQQSVSELERGRLEEVSLGLARRIAHALEIEFPIEPRWHGPGLARLLDEDHAAIVEVAVRALESAGFESLVEYTFNHFGERGSVDVVGWGPAARALIIIEVKSRIVDVQDLIGSTDRKLRIVPRLLAAERGWEALAIGRVVVLPETTAIRDAIHRHRTTFTAAYPARNIGVRRWLHDPKGKLSGLWFVRPTIVGVAPRRRGGPSRIRTAGKGPDPR